MNVDKARQLTLQSKHNLVSEKEMLWLSLSKFIFNEIEKHALLGKSEITIDINDLELQEVNNNFDYIKDKLEIEGFIVGYKLEKSINGRRELIIEW